MTDTVAFDVIGNPSPQGSKRAFVVQPKGGGKPRAVMTEASGGHREWRSLVRNETHLLVSSHQASMFTGPVHVKLTFHMPLPKTDPHRTLHCTTPDGDKLARTVLDAITQGGLIRDDALVCKLIAVKLYARDGHWTGCSIEVRDLSDIEAAARATSQQVARAARKASR